MEQDADNKPFFFREDWRGCHDIILDPQRVKIRRLKGNQNPCLDQIKEFGNHYQLIFGP